MQRSIQDFLGGSANALCLARMDLGGGGTVTIWENHDDRVRYDGPAGHVFSLYLHGGEATRRVDHRPRAGHAGAICILPEGHDSTWQIGARFRFVHLALGDMSLRAAFARIHDRDARLLDLPELTFADQPALARPLAGLARAAMAGARIAAEAGVAELIAALGPRALRLSGGLSPHLMRRLTDWAEAHLDQPIRLAAMAELAGMSEFHFHRMFSLTAGCTPQGWITARRIDRARRLLAGPLPIAEIALACGFSGQSHLTRAFRAQTGLTPAAWRRALAA
ncbi:helix-turn-helix domain-containing protein [Paracoccus limosus]|jgi:AraC family transcriptional regulator|uniref:Helix-turn-helix domain-containing protein n=1 Tax=Paracoccus limosus TaxID=913252 RepID=A0A844HAX0_9RHOB|nr:AraC family transcriptional regulator [Paracoccus limosus]MTH36177.1 helix-turn-helix domain-containing protein [Paracoccus limosus]